VKTDARIIEPVRNPSIGQIGCRDPATLTSRIGVSQGIGVSNTTREAKAMATASDTRSLTMTETRKRFRTTPGS
jgi:hypothetical protein